MRICSWCGVRLKWWQRGLVCGVCKHEIGRVGVTTHRWMERFPAPVEMLKCPNCFGIGCGLCDGLGQRPQKRRMGY